jgi:putative transposase
MNSFKGAQLPKEVVPVAVFFYVPYTVSNRDLEEIVAERGVNVDHAPLNPWVTRYSPMIASTAWRRKVLADRSWRMDQTCIKRKDAWV